MGKTAVYPKAIFADNGKSGGTYTSGPPKLVIHTTETSGMPGYDGGNTAPHLTYDPRSRIFIQHRTFREAARALRNEAGGVQTNRDTALQIEIICYSSKPTADQQPYRDWVGDLDKIPGALDDLAGFIDWVCDDWGIEKTWPGNQALTYSQANTAGFRMTGAEWDSFNGICGHQHVPEQTHWDPGAINWDRLVPTGEFLEEDDMPLTASDIEQIAEATREKIMGQPMSPSSGGVSFYLATDRNYRNISELTAAHRTGTLGADLDVEPDDVEAIASQIVDSLDAAGIANAVADELGRRLS